MQKELLRKGLIVVIIVLFIGESIVSGINFDGEKIKEFQ